MTAVPRLQDNPSSKKNRILGLWHGLLYVQRQCYKKLSLNAMGRIESGYTMGARWKESSVTEQHAQLTVCVRGVGRVARLTAHESKVWPTSIQEQVGEGPGHHSRFPEEAVALA